MSTIDREDPRIVRSRAAVIEAARTLFLEKGYAGTTVEEIAARAGIAKRTVYNNYADKGALFTQIVADVIAEAEAFARGLRAELTVGITASDLPATLHDLGRRMALSILRPEVVALRRLLIGETQAFPDLAGEYFERAPGRVLGALAAWFEQLGEAGLLRLADARRAAEQFAYLVVGEPLDRAMLVGKVPASDDLIACAREGVETFLARYGAGVYAVDAIERIGGSLPTTQERLVLAWTEIHGDELLEAWRTLQSGQPPTRIEPLR